MKYKRVSDLFDMKLGKMLSAKNYTGKHLKPYLRNFNVQWGSLDLSDVKEMDFDEYEFERYSLKKGDILVCEGGEVGRTAIYNGEIENCCYQNALHRLRIKNDLIKPMYFVYYMKYAASKGLIQRQTSTVTIAHFTAEKFKEFEIPLPDLKTQEKIAGILEQVDAARQKRKQANHLTEQFLQSTFLEMFGDNVEQNGMWKETSFGKVCEFIRGPFGGSLKKEIFKPQGYVVYEQNHAIYDQFDNVRYFIDNSKFNEMRRFELKPGDLIMSCSGTMGKVAIVPNELRPGIINQALLLLRPSKVVMNIFLKYWMESISFQNGLKLLSQGATIQNVVSVKILKEIKLQLPPISLQNKFTTIVHQVELLRSKQHESEKELSKLFKSLMQQYFG